ncbi:hypothetical protein GCM10010840_27530 [Deinococcus aerolatus]|uniref:Uncharacterized protein n=1 Tax=Deinococcus aerolatus TaxID=522487 RepID=A0ABQ2GEE4_9DEIO|nr:hypothetical protein GCM10010840_27530 [Deinococcus aerolatus]
MGVQAVERLVAVYRALLRLYPAEHRAAYSPHMLQVFQEASGDRIACGVLTRAPLRAVVRQRDPIPAPFS